jgi:hypothetical protein
MKSCANDQLFAMEQKFFQKQLTGLAEIHDPKVIYSAQTLSKLVANMIRAINDY